MNLSESHCETRRSTPPNTPSLRSNLSEGGNVSSVRDILHLGVFGAKRR